LIVRSADGRQTVIPDRYLSSVRTNGIGQASVSSVELEQITKANVPGRVPPGGILQSTSPYSKHDDTEVSYTDSQKIRRLLFENPLAYSYLMDAPRAALYTPRPVQAIKQDWQDSEEGVDAITNWQRLFEAREWQESLMDLNIGAAYYMRWCGEVLAWVGYLENPYLDSLGYVNNKMVGRVHLISPFLIKDLTYNRSTGKLDSLKLPSVNGGPEEITGPSLDNFIYFHNLPANEKRGVSRLRSTRRWLEGFDDLLELILEIYYNDARPIEHHTLDEDGLTPAQIEDQRDRHEANITAAIDEQMRMITTSKRVGIELKGFQGRTLEAAPMLDKTFDYTSVALQTPTSFTLGKNANKATVDVQLENYQSVQLRANDQATALKFSNLLYRKVLNTTGTDLRLVPTVRLPPFRAANWLEQVMAWQGEKEVFGQSRVEQIANEQGFAFDEMSAMLNEDGSEKERKNTVSDPLRVSRGD